MKIDKNDPLLAEQIQYLALQQIDLAREQLTNSNRQVDEAIHETRRCLKRLRAMLRLVKKEVGELIYDRDNSYFRNLGRQLSELRDATVIRQTLRDLQTQFPQTLDADTWRIIKKDLVGSRRIQPHKKLMAAVATKLKIARARVENWPLEFNEHTELQKAIHRTYRKGRRAMELTLKEPQTENFHEWRKQVNYLRHQLQILQKIEIGFVKVTLQDVRKLAQTLGLMNDLAVLLFNLYPLKSGQGEIELQRLEQLIRSHQKVYKTEAIKLGKALYHLPSKLLTT